MNSPLVVGSPAAPSERLQSRGCRLPIVGVSACVHVVVSERVRKHIHANAKKQTKVWRHKICRIFRAVFTKKKLKNKKSIVQELSINPIIITIQRRPYCYTTEPHWWVERVGQSFHILLMLLEFVCAPYDSRNDRHISTLFPFVISNHQSNK